MLALPIEVLKKPRYSDHPVVLITYAPHKSYGDISYTHQMEQLYTSLGYSVIFYVIAHRLNKDFYKEFIFKNSINANYLILNNKTDNTFDVERCTAILGLQDYCDRAHHIVVLPSIFSFSNQFLNSLMQAGSSKLLLMKEYNIYELLYKRSNKKIIELSSGFGMRTQLGVFLPKIQYSESITVPRGISTFIRNKTLQAFSDTQYLFSGYFARETYSEFHPGHRKSLQMGYRDMYLLSCLFLAHQESKRKDRKNGNKVVVWFVGDTKPLLEQTTARLMENIQLISEKFSINKAFFSNHLTVRIDEYQYQLHISGSSPLPQTELNALRKISFPFLGCTGDQSILEVLSIPGTVPFYQIMNWKHGLFLELLDIAGSINCTHLKKTLELFGKLSPNLHLRTHNTAYLILKIFEWSEGFPDKGARMAENNTLYRYLETKCNARRLLLPTLEQQGLGLRKPRLVHPYNTDVTRPKHPIKERLGPSLKTALINEVVKPGETSTLCRWKAK